MYQKMFVSLYICQYIPTYSYKCSCFFRPEGFNLTFMYQAPNTKCYYKSESSFLAKYNIF